MDEWDPSGCSLFSVQQQLYGLSQLDCPPLPRICREVRQQHPEDYSLKGHLLACVAASKLNLPVVKAELRDLKVALDQVDRTLAPQEGGEVDVGADAGAIAVQAGAPSVGEEDFKVSSGEARRALQL